MEPARPVHREHRAAHHAPSRRRIEGSGQGVHVGLVLVTPEKFVPKPADGRIGERQEPIEENAVAGKQLLLVNGFQGFFGRRQRGAKRVVDQVQD